MRARFVSELTEGARVDASFVVRSKEVRATRNGDAYLALTLADRTGAVPAVLFRPTRAAVAAPAGSVARVMGVVTVYRGIRRISIDSLTPADRWVREDLIASGPRPVEEMKAELSEVVRSIGEGSLRRLVSTVLKQDDVLERFCTLPASQEYHHAYLGGLLEHTLSVARLCRTIAEAYDGVDRDLLVAAAVLHDIGKVDELSIDTAIGYTDEGRLLGHVVTGLGRVRAAASRLKIERDLITRLEHALLSHHGELEWGSPKRPSTIEALLLHHADNLDAKAAGFLSLVAGASFAEETWTDASNLFRRPLFAPKPVESDRPLPAALEDLQQLSA